MKKIELHYQIVIALIVGILFGLFFTEYVEYIRWMGDLFLRALKMIIVPLILSSIISGVTNIGNAENLGRLGLKTMLYYILTSTFAIITGLILVNIFQPGVGVELGLSANVDDIIMAKESFGQTLMNIIPTNIFDSFANGQMLSIIFFSILFGFFITQVGEKPRTVLTDFFDSTFEVMMKVTSFIIKFAPLGILGIVAGIVADQADNLLDLVASLGIYMITVLLALAIHSTITLPLIVKFIAKSDPLKHFKAMTTPLLTAFSTSSSSATLPLTMEAVENNSGVSNKISSFTLPLGATVNMDGTALYECVAVLQD